MTDQSDKPKLGTRPPLGLKRTVETGKVKQSFSHGRSNTVVVEVKKRRILGKPGEVPAPAPEKVAEAPAPAPVAPTPAPKPAAPQRRLSEAEEIARRKEEMERFQRMQIEAQAREGGTRPEPEDRVHEQQGGRPQGPASKDLRGHEAHALVRLVAEDGERPRLRRHYVKIKSLMTQVARAALAHQGELVDGERPRDAGRDDERVQPEEPCRPRIGVIVEEVRGRRRRVHQDQRAGEQHRERHEQHARNPSPPAPREDKGDGVQQRRADGELEVCDRRRTTAGPEHFDPTHRGVARLEQIRQ